MKILQVKRVVEKQAEDELAKIILNQVIKNNMTILNLKEITANVINYMESNAILEMEDPDKTEGYVEVKSNFKIEEKLLQGLPEVKVKLGEEIAPDEIKKNMQ